jgi:hypothetical protein
VRLRLPRIAASALPQPGHLGPLLFMASPLRTSSLDLFNHLIRSREERRGDRQAEGLRGLQIDDQLELRGLLHGQVGGHPHRGAVGSRLRGRRSGRQVEMPTRVQPLPVTSDEYLSQTTPPRALRTS